MQIIHSIIDDNTQGPETEVADKYKHCGIMEQAGRSLRGESTDNMEEVTFE